MLTHIAGAKHRAGSLSAWRRCREDAAFPQLRGPFRWIAPIRLL